MHSRNVVREIGEIAADDDLDANADRIATLVTLLGPIGRIAESLHVSFGEFEAQLGTRP